MICNQCRTAGDYNSAANGPSSSASKAVLTALAENAHRACLWPETCPCQHEVGLVIRGVSMRG